MNTRTCLLEDGGGDVVRDYETFLSNKGHFYNDAGFDPHWMPDWLYDFQKYLVDWSLQKGRGAIFADCGLGKTPLNLHGHKTSYNTPTSRY